MANIDVTRDTPLRSVKQSDSLLTVQLDTSSNPELVRITLTSLVGMVSQLIAANGGTVTTPPTTTDPNDALYAAAEIAFTNAAATFINYTNQAETV